ncbi:type VI secretion system ImpA family N-terminal domain-containing protein [Vibrio sp. 1CM2L]|uniref:type VI secretion system protein TssA n=1 Tax=Vibrio sp. 1CM2L TaxID=2929166 RepID=UPI0020BDD1C5|nr:type VI secretion system ImpA family N-terminal domain-containing protein [Vibrio sp. 1CM2L]MCK8075595.1 type VI secretion system ImpA family N-terminal domain-containing protein [Vibrio sp. 1CM2L]
MTEIARLLVPISDEEPSGSYLKLDRSAYRSLRNVYNSAQSSFRQLVETPDASSDPAIVDANTDNWAELRKISEETLTSQSKDLEILGWYITSQLFTSQPFHNLANAIPALNLFIDQFWDTLNPMLPEAKLKASDDAGKAKEITEFKTKPLLQLVGESVDSSSVYIPFQMLDFCAGVTFGDYLTAERKGNIAELKESALGSFDGSVSETLYLLASIFSELEIAEKKLAEKCQAVGATVISFNFIKTNVRDLIKAIHFLVGEKFTPWPLDDNFHVIQNSTEAPQQDDSTHSAPMQASAPQNDSSLTTETSQNSGSSNPVNQGNGSVASDSQALSNLAPQNQTQTIVQNVSSINGIVNRDHAFQEIRKIAEYFKETEPHSPIAFLLERSIRWGYMSFPELLQEMVGNESVIAQINQMTGMDNLDKTDLSGKSVPVMTSAPERTPVATPTIEEPAAVSPVPDSSNSTTDKNQTSEPTSNSSSSSLQDFEW